MSARCSSVKTNDKNGDLSFMGQNASQWRNVPKKTRIYAPKKETIMLVGGLTILQDKLIESALHSIGENFIALPNPTFESFQTGKAFGNRGQCNPTYFTVGNLVKYLQNLRDKDGISTEEIVGKYVFVTAGGCGPCRFGMYITEYKKALHDAGFEGFRITSFEHDKGIFQGSNNDEESLLNLSPKFFVTLVRAILIGDILNLLGYKMRPYELEVGSVDKAMEECRVIISQAFADKKNLTLTLWTCRKVFDKVALNRLQVKPKVLVMGEFWAAMTEGDGNYNLHRFLEAEGAECIPQPIMNRLMLSIWEAERKLSKKANISLEDREDLAENKKIDFSHAKSRLFIKLAKKAVTTHFTLYAKALGLHDYEIPNMEKLATLSEEYYTLDCEGGEGHLEIAHLIESVKENLSHLTISVKPFGCMPSSAVSDGVQSLVTNRYPEANFLAIETSGEGAANFYSRVQMALFKAKQSAKEEFEAFTIPEHIPEKVHHYLYQPHSKEAGTAPGLLASLA
jgi:predicted nucleotide-binding protein (sugar kinase/HSP70/actin superfamily)